MEIVFLKRYLVFNIILIFCLSGCGSLGTYNPATGKNEFIFISTTEEIQLGDDIHMTLEEKYHIIAEGPDYDRVQRIGQRVAMLSDRQDYQYTFYIIDDDELNAFTTPGGNIYVNRGLIDKSISDDQIAFVLAHEIGHCAARHVVKKYQAALGVNLLGSILLSQIGEGSQQIARTTSGTLLNVVFSAYGRQDEYEADRLGVKYVYLSGYNPQAAIESFAILKRESKEGYAPLIFRTHPYIDERIEVIQEEIDSVEARYGPVLSKKNSFDHFILKKRC